MGDGEFAYPEGLAVGSDGTLYVADSGNSRIQEFDSSGVFLAKFGSIGSGDGELSGPYGVGLDAAGNIYVVERWNNRIQKFTGAGVFVTTWGSFGSGDGQFDEPQGLAVSADGHVYVADTNNHRIQKFTGDGTWLSSWGTQGSAPGEFQGPRYVALDSEGSVYVSDNGNNRIQKFVAATTGSPEGAPGAANLLLEIAPNPFARATTLRFSMGSARNIHVDIHDVRGSRVRALAHTVLGAGTHAMTWDGRDDGGRPVPVGIYFCRLTSDGHAVTRKLIVRR